MNIDTKLTTLVQEWLNTPAPGRDTVAGASLMLQLNRNRALYNSVLKHPAKYAAKLEYELRKHLHMRLDRMSASDVAALERRVMPLAAATVAAPPAAETPAVIDTASELPGARATAPGRRPDHDSLPPQVRELWDSNKARHERIVILFNELKAMARLQPCDRYEKLAIMADLDKTYRRNLALYDAYVPGTPAPMEREGATVSDEDARAIGAARKTLSKYKRIAGTPGIDPVRLDECRAKMQAAVNRVVALGGEFTGDYRAGLEEMGIVFPPEA